MKPRALSKSLGGALHRSVAISDYASCTMQDGWQFSINSQTMHFPLWTIDLALLALKKTKISYFPPSPFQVLLFSTRIDPVLVTIAFAEGTKPIHPTVILPARILGPTAIRAPSRRQESALARGVSSGGRGMRLRPRVFHVQRRGHAVLWRTEGLLRVWIRRLFRHPDDGQQVEPPPRGALSQHGDLKQTGIR